MKEDINHFSKLLSINFLARPIDSELKERQSKLSTQEGHNCYQCNHLSHLTDTLKSSNINKSAHALRHHLDKSRHCFQNHIKVFVFSRQRLWSQTEKSQTRSGREDEEEEKEDNREEGDEEEIESREWPIHFGGQLCDPVCTQLHQSQQ